MKKIFFVFVLASLSLFLSVIPVHSCMGRLLVIALGDSIDQVIMGQMLSVLINERTGTEVNILRTGDLKTCHEAVLNGEADIYISYIGTDISNIKTSEKVDNPQQTYILLRESYRKKFGMIWLKPFGFEGPLPKTNPDEKVYVTWAAPVTTKEVLRKFPILDRLINKLGGKIDNNTIDELRRKTENKDIKNLVREFLKAQRLI